MWIAPYIDGRTNRALDAALGAMLLVLCAPAMLLVAAAVWVCDGRPVLLRQLRAGRDGETFGMLKFRTMKVCPLTGAPATTRLGRVLRRRRLDELPQLLHVVRGTMSLVGPRPELPAIVARYTRRQQRRLAVRPGLTGVWQLRASRERRIHEDLGYDLYYLRKARLLGDLGILAGTVAFILSQHANDNGGLHPDDLPLRQRNVH